MWEGELIKFNHVISVEVFSSQTPFFGSIDHTTNSPKFKDSDLSIAFWKERPSIFSNRQQRRNRVCGSSDILIIITLILSNDPISHQYFFNNSSWSIHCLKNGSRLAFHPLYFLVGGVGSTFFSIDIIPLYGPLF